MKRLTLPAFLLAAASAVWLAPGARAQVETFDTISSYDGQAIEGFTSSQTSLTQTFNDVEELDSVTYALTTTGSDTQSQTIEAYLVEWNTSTNEAMSTISAPTTVGGSDVTTAVSETPLETFTIPPAGTGDWTEASNTIGGNTYDYASYSITLNLDQLLDPSLTYAIVLVDTSGDSGLGLIDISGIPPAFGYSNGSGGYGVYGTSYSGYDQSTLTSLEDSSSYQVSTGPYSVYGFSQIEMVPAGNVIPTPEPRTAAAALIALFVAGLVGRQLYRRRREAAPQPAFCV